MIHEEFARDWESYTLVYLDGAYCPLIEAFDNCHGAPHVIVDGVPEPQEDRAVMFSYGDGGCMSLKVDAENRVYSKDRFGRWQHLGTLERREQSGNPLQSLNNELQGKVRLPYATNGSGGCTC